MKKLILVFVTIAFPAAAQTMPSTLILPTQVVTAIRQYLGQRPHDEVAAMINALEACVAVQVPQTGGGAAANGECPAVTEALQAHGNGAKTDAPAPAK